MVWLGMPGPMQACALEMTECKSERKLMRLKRAKVRNNSIKSGGIQRISDSRKIVAWDELI